MLFDIGITVGMAIIGSIIVGIISSIACFPFLVSPAKEIIYATSANPTDITEAYLDVMLPTTLVLSLLTVGAAVIRPPTLTPYALLLVPITVTVIIWVMVSYPLPISWLPLISPDSIQMEEYIWFGLSIIWYGIVAGTLAFLLAAEITGTRLIF